MSFDANPSTGVDIYETSPRSGQGSWRVYGGTSLGAPVWAGIMAIVDQGRALEGKGSLDGATQTIPSLYALPKSDFKSVSPNDGFLDSGGLSSLLGDLFGSGSRWSNREHRNGPRITKRAVADYRPGGEHDHDEAVAVERDWSRLESGCYRHTSPSRGSITKPGQRIARSTIMARKQSGSRDTPRV